MRFPRILLPLASVCALASAKIVQDATEEIFESGLHQYSISLAAFTSGSAASLSGFNEIFASAGEDKFIPMPIIDCDKETEMCQRHGIHSYPTIRLYEKDKQGRFRISRYRDRRTKSAISSFVTRNELPALTLVTPEELDGFKKINDIVIIAYLRPDQEALKEIFEGIANKHFQQFVFGYTTDYAAIDAEEVSVPSIVGYRTSDGNNKVLNGKFTAADLEAFLATTKVDLIKEFQDKNMDDFMQPKKLTTYVFVESEESANALRHELIPIAKRYEKVVTFAMTDAKEYAPMAEGFGVQLSAGIPALVVHAPMNDNVFVYQQGKQIVGKVVEDMLTTVLGGKATSGQVFGEEAPSVVENAHKHDEL